MERFTRREAIVLSRTNAGRLAYLARTGIVVPHRLQAARRVRLLYSWEQILELRAINHLRQQVSLQTIRQVVEFLEQGGFEGSLHDKNLIIANGAVDWVRADCPQSPQILQVAGQKHVGQLKLLALPPLGTLVEEVWETARKSNVIDFESFRQRARSRHE
jgi:DNA-binding transcriptional MerR regulator